MPEIEARAVIPGHMQRGGSPSAYDRMLSTNFGVHAAQLLRAWNSPVSGAYRVHPNGFLEQAQL